MPPKTKKSSSKSSTKSSSKSSSSKQRRPSPEEMAAAKKEAARTLAKAKRDRQPRAQVAERERRVCSGKLEMINVSELKKMIYKLNAEPDLEIVMRPRRRENPRARPRRIDYCAAIRRRSRKLKASTVLLMLGPFLAGAALGVTGLKATETKRGKAFLKGTKGITLFRREGVAELKAVAAGEAEEDVQLQRQRQRRLSAPTTRSEMKKTESESAMLEIVKAQAAAIKMQDCNLLDLTDKQLKDLRGHLDNEEITKILSKECIKQVKGE